MNLHNSFRNLGEKKRSLLTVRAIKSRVKIYILLDTMLYTLLILRKRVDETVVKEYYVILCKRKKNDENSKNNIGYWV